MQKVEFIPKKNVRVGQFLRKFAEIVTAGGPYYIQPLCNASYDKYSNLDKKGYFGFHFLKFLCDQISICTG